MSQEHLPIDTSEKETNNRISHIKTTVQVAKLVISPSTKSERIKDCHSIYRLLITEVLTVSPKTE